MKYRCDIRAIHEAQNSYEQRQHKFGNASYWSSLGLMNVRFNTALQPPHVSAEQDLSI
jgi:hypothetical protein